MIPKPWAVDAQDRPVATSLSVSGSQLTMRIEHSPGSSSYPVIADPQVIMADAVDEYETKKADAETANYTYDQANRTTKCPTPPR